MLSLASLWLSIWLLVVLGEHGWLGSGGASVAFLLALPWLIVGVIFLAGTLLVGLIKVLTQRTFFRPLLVALLLIGLGFGFTRLPTQPEVEYRRHNSQYQQKIRALYPDGQGTEEFDTGPSHLALVYIGNDQPSRTYGACYGDGMVHKRLASNWYICRRDWN